MPVVEDFVAFYAARDWDLLATCFSKESFVRIGPYGDTLDSSREYLDFLRRVVPTLGKRAMSSSPCTSPMPATPPSPN